MKPIPAFVLMTGLAVLFACLASIGCGTAPSGDVPDCPNDGVELFLSGCPDGVSHICNDASGKLHAHGCNVRGSDGYITYECVSVCQ